MNLLDGVERELHAIDARGLHRQRRIAETPCGPHVTVSGRAARPVAGAGAAIAGWLALATLAAQEFPDRHTAARHRRKP